jgi:hypothetical protein
VKFVFENIFGDASTNQTKVSLPTVYRSLGPSRMTAATANLRITALGESQPFGFLKGDQGPQSRKFAEAASIGEDRRAWWSGLVQSCRSTSHLQRNSHANPSGKLAATTAPMAVTIATVTGLEAALGMIGVDGLSSE